MVGSCGFLPTSCNTNTSLYVYKNEYVYSIKSLLLTLLLLQMQMEDYSNNFRQYFCYKFLSIF